MYNKKRQPNIVGTDELPFPICITQSQIKGGHHFHHFHDNVDGPVRRSPSPYNMATRFVDACSIDGITRGICDADYKNQSFLLE